MAFLRFFIVLTFLSLSHYGAAQIDTIEVLFRNSFEVFESLRNDKGVYRDSKVFEGEDFHPSSVATTGMGLISLCIADAMGWTDDAEAQAIKTIETMTGLTPGFEPDRNANGYYRHWIDMETGMRAWDSEYSTIDSGIFYAGVLFAYKYFCARGNGFTSDLVNGVIYSPKDAIDDPVKGTIFLKMNADGSGDVSALTLPFNEYMIAAWLTDINTDNWHKGQELWYNHYNHTDSLTTNNFNGIDLLTDDSSNFLSSFVIQFPYYLVHYFTTNNSYLQYLENARLADSTWWSLANKGADYHWGLGAGSTNYGSGYHADKINNNPSFIHSPHIIAGFLPVSPKDTVYLKQQYADGSNLYTLPNAEASQVLWRKSLDDPSYMAQEIQGVDYSTMLFGLATLDRFLGKDFFSTYNDFYTPPCSFLSSSTSEPVIVDDLFIAYPNPTSLDSITIELDNEYRGSLTVQIYDVLGRKYFSTIIDKFDSLLEYDIDASAWSQGMYIIAVSGDSVRGSARVMKE